MPEWHLDELRSAFERRGWCIVAELPDDGYRVSASWELRRGGSVTVLIIDFDGLADLVTLPIVQAYGCEIRGSKHSFYFTRRRTPGSAARAGWHDALARFVLAAENWFEGNLSVLRNRPRRSVTAALAADRRSGPCATPEPRTGDPSPR
jgi:hypothetical protein